MSDISGVSSSYSFMNPTTDRAPSNELGKDAFLKLLVAQLKYQNPLEPTDPQAFMTQTAQFTMVEKLEELSKLSVQNTLFQQLSMASSLVGRQVTYHASDGTQKTGLVSTAKLLEDGTVLEVGADEVYLEFVTEVAAGS